MITDSFVEHTVKTKVGARYYLRLFACVLLIIAGLPLLLIQAISGLGLLTMAFGIYLITYFWGDKNSEYEYSMTNGSVEIAVIYNLSRRKTLYSFDMSNVAMVVPFGSNRISNEKFNKTYDFTSKTDGGKKVSIVVDEDGKKTLVSMEPNEKAMNHIIQFAKHKCYDL